MKTFKIEIPKGCEIDSVDKETGEVTFKKFKYPVSLFELHENNYRYYIDSNSNIRQTGLVFTSTNLLSSEKRAEAFLTLMQLVEYRDAWNEIDGFEADWDTENQYKFVIYYYKGYVKTDWRTQPSRVLYFGSAETRDLFLKTFKDLIETAKELL